MNDVGSRSSLDLVRSIGKTRFFAALHSAQNDTLPHDVILRGEAPKDLVFR
jgi:hypothetical protein